MLNSTKNKMNQGYTIEQWKEKQGEKNNFVNSIECIKTCSEGSFNVMSNLIKDRFINNIAYSSKTIY